MKNKRGLSNTVTVVLFVLLGIVIIGILWGIISHILPENKDLDTEFIDGKGALIKSVGFGNVGEQTVACVLVEREDGSSDDMKKLKFIVSDGITKKFSIVNFDADESETEWYALLDVTGFDVNDIDEVEVYPVLVTADGDKIASEASSVFTDSFDGSCPSNVESIEQGSLLNVTNTTDDGCEDDYECPDKYVCEHGECVIAQGTCVADGKAIDYYNLGSVVSDNIELSDTCSNSKSSLGVIAEENILFEVSCDENDFITGEEYNCSKEGKVCYEGICQEGCVDSDGGSELMMSGQTKNATTNILDGEGLDWCDDDGKIIEYSCDGVNVKKEILDCPEGYVCDNSYSRKAKCVSI